MPPIPDALASRILSDLAEPTASLASVAAAHDIPLATLSLWLTTPAARERMLLMESGACAHVRMAASLNLSSAVAVLVSILEDFRKNPTHHAAPLSSHTSSLDSVALRDLRGESSSPLPIAHSPLPTSPLSADAAALRLSLRRAENARRAAYHLYRLSRITPLTDEQIARALARRQERAAPALTTDKSSRVPAAPVERSETEPASATRLTSSSSTPSSPLPAPTSSSSSSSHSSPQSPSSLCPLCLCGESCSCSSPRLSAALRVEPSSPPSRSRSPAKLLRAATAKPIPCGSSP